MAASEAKTRISVGMKNGEHATVYSALEPVKLVQQMGMKLGGFTGFEDVNGSILVVNVSDISNIMLTPIKAKDDAATG